MSIDERARSERIGFELGCIPRYPYSNSASVSAGVGFAKVSATNSSAEAAEFPGAAADPGWNDAMTITGGMKTTAHCNLYGDYLHADAWNDFLTLNGGNVDGGIRNSNILSSWDSQAAFYGATDDNSPGDVPNYSLNRLVYFAIPFTFNQQFEFGFYIGGTVGERA